MRSTTQTSARPSLHQRAAALVIAVLVVATAAAGALSAADAAADYQRFDRPAWSPPSWVFGPVWTVLYVMIGLAGWLVWRSSSSRLRTVALGAWLVQLVLNAAWTPLFFGARQFGAAFAEVCALWVAIAVTVVFAGRAAGRPAAALLVPYWLWTTFAAALTFAVWQAN